VKTPLKTDWQRFREDRPGRRFQNLHLRRRNGKSPRYPAERIVNSAGGIGLVAVGVVLVPAPGPGWVIVAIGFGVLASEFLSVARLLDCAELQARRWLPRKPPGTVSPLIT
jgi:hypothetical protein